MSDAEALGVEIVGDQEFCSYEEQVAILDNSDSSHSTTSDL